VKVALISFNQLSTVRAYKEALRQRLYAAGHQTHQVTEMFRDWFPPQKLTAYIAGTDDAERAADVALEVSGVLVKLKEVP
jgi:hypothetical protein